MLVAWASQTGFATALAERSAAALRESGRQVLLLPLDQVDGSVLAATRRALFIASTTGEGDPPDHALRFLRGPMAGDPALAELEYALLALGDREYVDFCAFGRQLDEWLRHRGARPLFDRVEVDNADEAALRHWQYELGRIAGTGQLPDWAPPAYEPWRLVERELLNPDSQGGPVYDLRLLPATGPLPAWQPGDIAEIGPRNPPARVSALLRQLELDGETVVAGERGAESLAALLARSQLPDADGLQGLPAAALAARLRPLPHREYSIASIPEDGQLHLLVREMTGADGQPGLGSGWLCRHARRGDAIDLRLRANPGFHPPPPGKPLILVGNGTGLAGLRAHLHARVAAGARRNWLLFGERNADRDFFHREELRELQAQGWLQRLDLAFARRRRPRLRPGPAAGGWRRRAPVDRRGRMRAGLRQRQRHGAGRGRGSGVDPRRGTARPSADRRPLPPRRLLKPRRLNRRQHASRAAAKPRRRHRSRSGGAARWPARRCRRPPAAARRHRRLSARCRPAGAAPRRFQRRRNRTSLRPAADAAVPPPAPRAAR